MRRLLAAGALLTGLTLLTTSMAVAQVDPSASPSVSPSVAPASEAPAQQPEPYQKLCEVFDPAAVSAALGGERLKEERAIGTRMVCRYSPRGKRTFTELTALMNELEQESYVYGEKTVDTIYELLKLNYPDATETEVAGAPALQAPVQRLIREARGWTAGTLYVVPDRTSFLQLSAYAPRGVDVDDALVQLAELAAPRLFASTTVPEPSTDAEASMSPEPAGSPEGSLEPTGDDTASAPFPDGIRGDSVEVAEEWNGRDWLDALSPPADLRRRLVRALEAQDRSLGDLQLQILVPSSGLASITAFNVADADMGRLSRPLLQALPIGRDYRKVDPADVGGKETVVSIDDGGNELYAYSQGDMLWLVSADEADLAEIFGQLP